MGEDLTVILSFRPDFERHDPAEAYTAARDLLDLTTRGGAIWKIRRWFRESAAADRVLSFGYYEEFAVGASELANASDDVEMRQRASLDFLGYTRQDRLDSAQQAAAVILGLAYKAANAA